MRPLAILLYRFVAGLWGVVLVAAALDGKAPWWVAIPGALLLAYAPEAFARDIIADRLQEIAK